MLCRDINFDNFQGVYQSIPVSIGLAVKTENMINLGGFIVTLVLEEMFEDAVGK